MLRLSVMLAVASVACVPGMGRAQKTFSPPTVAPATETAQPTVMSTVQLSAEQAADFGLALEAIAAQAKVAFAAEGTPFKTTLSIEDTTPLTKPTPAEELVDKIAAAYDYRVVRVKASRRPDAPDVRPQPHVFALVKKYTDPDDLPDVTLEECQAAMRDVNQMLLSVGPNPPIRVNTPFILAIADGLTPEQEARLKEGIPVSELPNNVRGKIQQFGMHMYAGMRQNDAFGALAALTGIGDTTLRYMDYWGDKVIGFDNFLFQTQDGGTFRMPKPLPSKVNDYVSTSNDPVETVPKEPDVKLLKKTLSHTTIVGAMGLQQAVTTLANDPAASYTVDTILAEKKVVVAGVLHAPAKEMADSLAQVYGLRVSRLAEDGGDRYRIARRVPPALQQPAGVFDLVRQILPEPLLRASFDGEQEERIQAAFKAYTTVDQNLPREERMRRYTEGRKKFSEGERRFRGAASNLAFVAAKQLQAEGEQLLVKQPKGISFAALPRSMRNNYAITAISTFIGSLSTVPVTPDYIKDWNNAVISGGPYIEPGTNEPSYSLKFMGRDKDGNPHTEAEYLVLDKRPNAQRPMP